MTTPNPTPADTDPNTPGQTPVDTPPADPTTEPSAEPPAEPKSGNSEAARYRRQLRDTEAQRDQLAERITVYERGEAQRHADRLADPTDLWTAGIELDELRGVDGTIDPTKVAAAVDQVLRDRPHWAKSRTPQPDRRQGASGEPVHPGRGWSGVLKR
ncbi:hypothetical protein [Rhodococcus sp. AH-ZY2]|uniref:hypothetical protein n=1 Tax=Rhodococcus sp. AH-ZY2 TaxID=3047468 RepID=UPI0027E21047|nr:hypothetical protein [Rhodococcus sp. AH-ZY2]WML64763.1 hypothetical protein QNA09_08225 [Rhodococcus sp. AH-ZY2]